MFQESFNEVLFCNFVHESHHSYPSRRRACLALVIRPNNVSPMYVFSQDVPWIQDPRSFTLFVSLNQEPTKLTMSLVPRASTNSNWDGRGDLMDPVIGLIVFSACIVCGKVLLWLKGVSVHHPTGHHLCVQVYDAGKHTVYISGWGHTLCKFTFMFESRQ